MFDSIDTNFLKQAIEISKQSPPSATRFSVGAVLVDQNRHFVSSGFSQELGDGWHAEAVAIKKALDNGFNPKGSTIYSSMEPCSVRASGKRDCCSLLIEKEISRVVFALSEPPTFVVCEGQSKLKAAGIEVEQIASLEEFVIAVNKHLLPSKAASIKSKLIACAIFSLLTYTNSQAFAAGPQTENKQTGSNLQNPQEVVGRYYTQALKQFAAFGKDSIRSSNLIDSHGQINEKQVSDNIHSLPIKNDQVTKSLEFVKGLVYNPSNPGPFLHNLIALQSISVNAQSQLIPIAEGALGPKNSCVLQLRENYAHSVKYLEALKLQKQLLEQSRQVAHKQL